MTYTPCDPTRDEALWRSPTKVTLVAAAVLCDPDSRILIAKRPEGKPMAGLWEFPGGKVKENEAPEACLVRELEEEIGIHTHTSCLFALGFASHRYEDFHLLMPLYVCRNWQNPPRGKEGQELKWIRKHEIMQFEMPAANDVLKVLVRDL